MCGEDQESRTEEVRRPQKSRRREVREGFRRGRVVSADGIKSVVMRQQSIINMG